MGRKMVIVDGVKAQRSREMMSAWRFEEGCLPSTVAAINELVDALTPVSEGGEAIVVSELAEVQFLAWHEENARLREDSLFIVKPTTVSGHRAFELKLSQEQQANKQLRQALEACEESIRLLVEQTGMGTAEWCHSQVSLRMARAVLDGDDKKFNELLSTIVRDGQTGELVQTRKCVGCARVVPAYAVRWETYPDGEPRGPLCVKCAAGKKIVFILNGRDTIISMDWDEPLAKARLVALLGKGYLGDNSPSADTWEIRNEQGELLSPETTPASHNMPDAVRLFLTRPIGHWA